MESVKHFSTIQLPLSRIVFGTFCIMINAINDFYGYNILMNFTKWFSDIVSHFKLAEIQSRYKIQQKKKIVAVLTTHLI